MPKESEFFHGLLAVSAAFYKAFVDLPPLEFTKPPIALGCIGWLIALFGLVFSLGALTVHTNLYNTLIVVRGYLKTEVELVVGKPYLDSVVGTKSGATYRLTKVFLIDCSLSWLTLGWLLMWLAFG